MNGAALKQTKEPEESRKKTTVSVLEFSDRLRRVHELCGSMERANMMFAEIHGAIMETQQKLDKAKDEGKREEAIRHYKEAVREIVDKYIENPVAGSRLKDFLCGLAGASAGAGAGSTLFTYLARIGTKTAPMWGAIIGLIISGGVEATEYGDRRQKGKKEERGAEQELLEMLRSGQLDPLIRKNPEKREKGKDNP